MSNSQSEPKTMKQKYANELKDSGTVSDIDFLLDPDACHPGNFPTNPFNFSGLLDGKIGLPSAGNKVGAEVAVIGAGCAGLAAANLLMRAGLKPVIYERSDRIGGRTYSKPLLNEKHECVAYAELGAMRIPKSQQLIFDLCARWGIQWKPFPNPLTVNTAVNVYGQQVLYDASTQEWTGPAPLIAQIKEIARKYKELIHPITTLWERTESIEEKIKLWQQFVRDYDNKSFFQVLVENGWTTGQIQLFGYIGIGSGGFNSFYGASFLEIVRIGIQQLEVHHQLIEGGVEQFPINFWNEEVECAHWGKTSVKALNQGKTRAGVQKIAIDRRTGLTTITDVQNQSNQFAAVVLTASPRAIDMTMDIDQNAFSTDVWSALRSIELTGSTKVFVLTKTAFWLDPTHPGSALRMTLTDRMPRQIYLFSAKELGIDSDYGVICLSYAWASSSINFNSLNEQQRIDVCLDAIEKIYPGMHDIIRAQMVPNQNVSICWEDQYGYNGGWRMANPGQAEYVQLMHEQCLGLNPEWNNGLYLAGEAMSWYGLSGWIEGAIQTGLQAGLSAIKRVAA